MHYQRAFILVSSILSIALAAALPNSPNILSIPPEWLVHIEDLTIPEDRQLDESINTNSTKANSRAPLEVCPAYVSDANRDCHLIIDIKILAFFRYYIDTRYYIHFLYPGNWTYRP
ncbi:hypothetical protein BDV06DRAFT_83438 [Aspergillus oleicola]